MEQLYSGRVHNFKITITLFYSKKKNNIQKEHNVTESYKAPKSLHHAPHLK